MDKLMAILEVCKEKGILLDEILDYLERIDRHPKALQELLATLRVTRHPEDGDRVSTNVTVSCGGSQDTFPVANHTVGEVAELLQEVLNIPQEPMVVVNGKTLEDYDYVLQDGDVLEYIQKLDKKG